MHHYELVSYMKVKMKIYQKLHVEGNTGDNTCEIDQEEKINDAFYSISGK